MSVNKSVFVGSSVLIKASKFDDKDFITYYNKPVVVYPEKDNKEIFYLDIVSEVKKKVPLAKYVNSFANDVGILNIARRLAIQGENIWDGRFAVKENSFLDATKLPKNPEELRSLMSLKNKLWASLDKDLKGNMTFEEFCESFDNKKLAEYISSKSSVKEEIVSSEVKSNEE